MTIKLTHTISETKEIMADNRQAGKKIALIPTMGALHEGHASLIRTAHQEAGFVVVSIFVNPTQFGPREDLDKYPRTLEKDLQICSREGADLVFAPTPEIMYPSGFCTFVEVHGLQNELCGKSRPTHFRGVTTVVLKLFNIVEPDLAYFGQKDAQQCRVLEQMANDLNLTTQMRICPIVREVDGLAMSSRNQYLDQDQRERATSLFHALQIVHSAIVKGERNAGKLVQLLLSHLENTPGARLDYAEIVDYGTLKPVRHLQGKILVAVAVYFGETRLIDNFIVDLS